MSAVDNLVDNVISHLQVPQKIYDPPKWEKPDLSPYPVDYLYSGRLLLSLGDTFKDYKIEDNLQGDFSFYSAVSYCISSSGSNGSSNGINMSESDFCQRVGINVMVVGPAPNKYSLVLSQAEGGKDGPYVIIYHSMEDLYYPIVTLERRESNIHYRQSSSILQKLMPE
jgi:hypothetical protein